MPTPHSRPSQRTSAAPRIWKWFDVLLKSYLFLPSAVVAAGIVLAIAVGTADGTELVSSEAFPKWMRFQDPVAARIALTTIAGAAITIVSLTFSISIVVMTLATSQFGPRVLASFLRDRVNQVVLGVFLATFVYCLLAIVSVGLRDGESDPPQLTLTVALALSLGSIAALIFFLHHIADSIQASTIVDRLARDLDSILARSTSDEHEPERDDGGPDPPRDARPLISSRAGTLQAIDVDALASLAQDRDAEVWLARRVGGFVPEGGVLAHVRGPADDELADAVRATLILGSERTPVQDLELGFDRLAEVALRALSPGINDPFTAMSCIDRLANGLGGLACRGAPPTVVRDGDGAPRIHVDVGNFASLAEAAFGPIRVCGRGHPAVMTRLLDALATLAPVVRTDAQLDVLLEQARVAHEIAHRHAETDPDRRGLDRGLAGVETAVRRARG